MTKKERDDILGRRMTPEQVAARISEPMQPVNDGWVVAEERKPPNIMQRVLVTNQYGYMAVGMWDDSMECWYVEGEKWVNKPSGPITHWRPLPAQPSIKLPIIKH